MSYQYPPISKNLNTEPYSRNSRKPLYRSECTDPFPFFHSAQSHPLQPGTSHRELNSNSLSGKYVYMS